MEVVAASVVEEVLVASVAVEVVAASVEEVVVVVVADRGLNRWISVIQPFSLTIWNLLLTISCGDNLSPLNNCMLSRYCLLLKDIVDLSRNLVFIDSIYHSGSVTVFAKQYIILRNLYSFLVA